MTRTSNYDLIVVEGNDKVNLLTQMNPNTEKIDEVMKTNEKSGVQVATELLSGTVHAITRTVKSASMFKFTAISNYTSGDTFTVDGVQVTALLTSGEALGTGAYIIGSEVLCSLKDTLLTVYTQGGTVKIAEDAEKLGGNLPEYYAKQSELDIVKNTADSASSLSRTNSESINNINKSLTNLKNPAKGTKGIFVNGGSALTKDCLLVYTIQSTDAAYSGASLSINDINVAQLTVQNANCKQTIVGSVRAFKGNIINITKSNFGGDISVYAYITDTI